MPVPFHADEKLGESVAGAMTLGISERNAPALAGCAQAHPSAPQIVAWPPAPKRLLCLLKPGAWSGEYPNGAWRRELLPIALYDCVHGASGMPSEGMTSCSGSSLPANTRLAPNNCGARVAMPTLDFACACACGYVNWLAGEQFVIPPPSPLQYRRQHSFGPYPTSADPGLPFYPLWPFRRLCYLSSPTIRRHNDKEWPAYA